MAQPEQACLRAWRGELLASVGGEVLEIGAGTGASLPAYGAEVTRLVLTEPDRTMRRQLESKAASAGGRATVVPASVDALPFPDESFDAVTA